MSYQCRHATSALVTDSGRSLKAFISLKAMTFSHTDSGIHSCIYFLPTDKNHENLLRGDHTKVCSQAAICLFPHGRMCNLLITRLITAFSTHSNVISHDFLTFGFFLTVFTLRALPPPRKMSTSVDFTCKYTHCKRKEGPTDHWGLAESAIATILKEWTASIITGIGLKDSV